MSESSLTPSTAAPEAPTHEVERDGAQEVSLRSRLTASLSRRLKEQRVRRGWTQGEVAQRIHSHVSAVSRWESGVRLPSLPDLLALGHLFDISTDELLGREEQPPLASGVLLDQKLLGKLEQASDTESFDRIVEDNAGEALWLAVPNSACVVPADEARRRAEALCSRFPRSKHAGRLLQAPRTES